MIPAIYHRIKFWAHRRIITRLPAPLASRWANLVFGKKDLYILLEHPKCGRTWLRFMIHQAESKKFGIPLINTLNRVRYGRHSVPRVAFNHGFKPGVDLEDHHFGWQHDHPRRKGLIFLIRNPLRVMISYYHHIVFRQGDFEGEFSDFIHDQRYGIESFTRYVDFYYGYLADKNHLIVKFEDLKKTPFEIFKTVLDFCELSLDDASVRDIVANSTFEKMKENQENRTFSLAWLEAKTTDSRSDKFRSGGEEDIKDYYDDETLEYVRGVCGRSEALRALGYLENLVEN